MSDVGRIRAASPAAAIYIYLAGHGCNCDLRASYHAETAALARKRTLALRPGTWALSAGNDWALSAPAVLAAAAAARLDFAQVAMFPSN